MYDFYIDYNQNIEYNVKKYSAVAALCTIKQEVWRMSNPNGGGMSFMGVVGAIFVALCLFALIG